MSQEVLPRRLATEVANASATSPEAGRVAYIKVTADWTKNGAPAAPMPTPTATASPFKLIPDVPEK